MRYTRVGKRLLFFKNQPIQFIYAKCRVSDDDFTQVKATCRDNTYGEVATRQPLPTKINQRMLANKESLPHHEIPPNVDDGFRGVERRHNRIKKFS